MDKPKITPIMAQSPKHGVPIPVSPRGRRTSRTPANTVPSGYRLVFLSGPRAGSTVSVMNGSMLGRNEGCGPLHIGDPQLSSVHCRFESVGSNLYILDNGSRNGTFVNKTQLRKGKKTLLRECDTVLCGNSIIKVILERVTRKKAHWAGIRAAVAFTVDDERTFVPDHSLVAHKVQHDMDAQDGSLASVNHRLRASLKVSEYLTAHSKKDELRIAILQSLMNMLAGAERAFLLVGASAEELEPAAFLRRDAHDVVEDDIPAVSKSMVSKAMGNNEVLIYDQSVVGDDELHQTLALRHIRHAMAIPLMLEDERLGLIIIDSSKSKGKFDDTDVEIAAGACRQISVALKSAMLRERLEADIVQRASLMRYLPRTIVDDVLDGSVSFDLGGKACDGTIMFSDIISFTKLCEALSPTDVIDLLNKYFGIMMPIVELYEGALDKLIGDCMMALWGIPMGDEQICARNALRTALHLQRCGLAFNHLQRQVGGPELFMGVGLNFGPVIAGNIGTTQRMEYTCVGDAVNTAQRIESRACGEMVLVSTSVWEVSGNAIGFAVPSITVKNKADPIEVMSVRGLKEDGDEIALCLPVRIGAHRGVVFRRLSVDTFLLLHTPECDLNVDWTLDIIETHHTIITAPVSAKLLTEETDDLGMRRSEVTFDPNNFILTLISDMTSNPITSPFCWTDMDRTSSVMQLRA